jgi:hypothetical protein
MAPRVLLGPFAGLFAVLGAVACSNDPPPSGPAETCTGYSDQIQRFAGAADDGGAGYAPTCLPFSPSEVGASLSCTVFVTLDGAGDETACASSGLETPDPATLAQLRSAQATDWQKAGGEDSGVPEWSTYPTCLVPKLPAADLDDAGSCASAANAGWCLTTGGPCASEIVLAPQGVPSGSLVTIECQECTD